MGIFCKMLDHKNEAINFWGENCEYLLFKCKRCNHEEIFCSYEGKILNNDEFGKKILDKMMKDKEFSKACHVHSQFVKAEHSNPFNFKKQEEEYERIRKEFNLTGLKRPACPIELFRAGLWIDTNNESGKSKKKSNTKIKTKPIVNDPEPDNEQGEIYNVFEPEDNSFTNEVKPIKYSFESVSKGETLEGLQKLEKIYVARENYEKAAEIYKKIQKLKENKK